MATAVTMAVVGLTLATPTVAEAAVVQWGTNSGSSPNYQANVNGDFIMAGNGVLACTGAPVANTGTCNDLHAATNANTDNVNDNFLMTNSNTVSGFTTNSSSATMTIPAGATVAKAFLTWSANTGVYTGDSRLLCTGYSAARGTATIPTGSATGYTTRAVQFKVGGGAITNISPSSMLVDPTSQATTRYYSASADVTSSFAGVTTGSEITLSTGNIWAATGAGCYAGWSITVVYDFGTYIVGNANSAPHNIVYYEGHVRQGASDADLTVAFNGFTAVSAGTRAGFTLFEGDRNITGDTASYARGGSTTYTAITSPLGVTNNIGVGRAEGSVRYAGAAGTAFTNQSVDVATTALTNVIAGDSSVSLKLGTVGDSYLLRNAVLSVPTAGLQVSKTYDGTADTQSRTANERATFTIRVTNTGAGVLRNIVIQDDQTDCSRTLTGITLAPLEYREFTCTATAASSTGYVSTANATAYTVVGNFLAQDSDSTTVLLSAVSLTKTSALAPGATGRAGDVVTYTFTVTNTGQSTLNNIVITDPLVGLSAITFGTWPGATGVLTAGQSVTATATYTLKQSDVDAGSIANSARVVASDDDGGEQPTAPANRTTPIASAGSLSVSKTGVLAPGATGRVGDRINYTFSFTNTGNVTLANATLADPLSGLSPPVVTWPTSTTGTLAPGQTATATAFYLITQADVDAGSVRNTATVTARTPGGTIITGTSPQVTVPTIASAPGLVTTKSGSVTSGTGGVGSTVTYTLTARNSGNVTLTGVSIADPLTGLSALTYTWPGTSGRLAPGQSVTATATYTITQADVNAGSVKNTATGTATTPAGATLTAPSSQVTVPTIPANPALTLTKTGALAPGSTGRAGDVVTYSFTLANSGNVTLTQVGITDPLSGLSALTYTWPGTAGTLAPGQQVTATATYTLKQSDVDAGSVANTATATGTPPTGAAVTQTRSATVPIAPTSALTVLKSGSVTTGTGGVGSTVTYNFSATNNGNVTLTQVAIADPLSGLSSITYTWPGTSGTLAPGQTVTGRATYTIKQSDLDAGVVTNTATATGRTPAGATVSGTSPTITVPTAAASPASTTTKSASVSGTGRVGDVITYTVRTTNTGNVTLTGVAISDPLSGLSAFAYTWPGTAGRLAPGQTVTAVATYTIKQTDVDAGSVRNTAGSTASYGNTPVPSSSGQVVTNTAAAAPGIVATKSGALQSGSSGRAGDTIVWSITLRNSGNVTLTGVTVADSLPGISAPTYGTWPSGTTGTLAPGQTVTATATSTISQADVNSGAVANTATGSGQPPTGAVVSSAPAPATVSLASSPGLTITKTGSVTAGTGGVGSTVTYNFSATNTGNVTLTGVAISDPHAGLSSLTYTWPGTAGTLQPNQTVTATATYAIRQSDVDAGSTKNTATVTGTPPRSAAITATSTEVTVPTVAAAPAITTTKSATGGGGGVGSTVTYSFRAVNTGNVTLTGVTITDPLSGLSSLNYSWPGAANTLAPGQAVTATATYTVTQADVDAGSVTNTSTARGTGGGTTVTANSSAVVTPTAASAPRIAVAKTGTLSGTGVAGDTVTYSFTVSNPGNVTLTGVALTDPLIGATPIALSGWAGTAGTLAPGASVTGTATYTLLQSDVDAGSVANVATATGLPPRGAAVTGTGAATVPIAAVPSIAVTKSGALTAGTGGVGSTITFTIQIRNSGNVSLSGVTLSDTLAGLTTPVITWPGATGTLAPGQIATATATYTVRQADVDAGSVRNTASVNGRPPTGAVVSATSTAAVVQTTAAAPALTVTKTSTTAAGNRVGDVVSYTIRAENTGNQTLTGVTITDPLPGMSGLAITWPGTAGTLAPGQAATARGTYTITQADVNAGTIRNTATANATAPGNVAVTGNAVRDTATVAANAQIALTKSAALPVGSSGKAGDVVTYSFLLRNTGNVTVTGVTVTDPLVGLSTPVFAAWPGTAGTLQPGQSVTATATRTLLQSDVDAGSVANTATATGTAPGGAAVSQNANATLALTAGPALTLSKTGTYTTGSGAVGSIITYGFSAQNTGNVTLTGVAITDPHTGLSAIAPTWPGSPGTLAPGQTVTGSATYTVTQADVDNGSVTNTARVVGTPPTGAAVSANSSTVVLPTAASGPGLAVTKSASLAGTGVVGDVITYTISAANTGNVTLRSVALTDTLPGLTPLQYNWPGAEGTLAPGQAVTATTTRTITQTDVDAGTLVNIATATATAPNGAGVTGTSTAATTPTVPANPQLQVTKSGSLPVGAAGVAGETISWTVTIRNSGNVTLTGVTASDSLPGISALIFGAWPGGVEGTLAPGASVTATATSTVRQSDVNAGSVANTATATGTPSRGQAASAVGSATVPLTSSPAVTIVKTGSYTTGDGAVDSVITYVYTVRNAGNVTLTGVTIADPHSGLSAIAYGTWPSGVTGTLDPNQTVTATATYVVRQSDVNTGSVTDRATVSGRPPTGAAVNGTSEIVVLNTAAAAPAIATTKTAAVSGTGAVGDIVTYTFTARNTGNVTLTGVAISDPAPGLSALTYGQWPAASGTLQPGQSVTATATHRITQADVNAGSIANTATSTGTPPAGPAVTSSDSVVTNTVAAAPSVDFQKTGSLAPGATGRVGDRVDFSFSVRNTGNVTLNGVALTDRLTGISAPVITWPGADGVLAPNQVMTARATYTLTQADVDAGGIANTADLAATPPTGPALTPTASVTVPVAPASTLAVTKAGTILGGGDGDADDVIRFAFTVTNTGNVTLSGVTFSDPRLGAVTPTVDWPGAVGVLAPGAVATATADYDITQGDVDAGSVTNTVTVTGTTPAGATTTGTAETTIPMQAPDGELTLTKTGSTAVGENGVDDVITYTFEATNSGNVTLTGVQIDDPLSGISAISYGTWPGTVGTLAPGQSITATATYTIRQADVNTGVVRNTATATGTSPGGATITDPSPENVVTLEPADPRLEVTDAGLLEPGATGATGDDVVWTYVLTNRGNVTLTGVALADALAGTSAPAYVWQNVPFVLQPGESVTATARTALTQADVDAGSIISVVTGRGTPPTGADATATASATVPITPSSVIQLTKTASATDDLVVGQQITYTFGIRNGGTVTLDGVALSDGLAGLSAIAFGTWPGGREGRLAPGAQVSATATYTVTQADVDRGSIVNAASVTARPPAGASVSATAAVTATTEDADPGITLTKTGPDAFVLGDALAYGFVVENTGNVTLTGVAIEDELDGLSDIAYGAWPGAIGVLAPGETVAATATYTALQSDVDAGTVVNRATASGTPPTGAATTSTDETTATAPAAAPVLTVDKTGALAAGSTGRAGDTVEYRFVVVNSGDVTISDVVLTDPLPGLSPIVVTWPAADGVLAPGRTATATATYTLTQADVDAGAVSNTVTVDGEPVRGALGPVAGRQDSETVAIAPGAALTAVKSGVLTGGGIGQVGDVIQYEITATNTGNLTITGGGLIDGKAGLYDLTIAWPGVDGRLEVGQSVTGRAKYRITQADVDAGFVWNQGRVGGQTSAGAVSALTNEVRIETVQPAASLAVTKTGQATGERGVGDQVEYEFGITNTGNVSVTDVELTDIRPDVTLSAITWPDPAFPGRIEPGKTATATGTLAITQTLVDQSRVVNTATASGAPVRGPASVSATSPESIVPLVDARPDLTVTDAGALATGATGAAGDVVTWTYVLTNSGNVTLSAAALADALAGVSDPSYTWTTPEGVLAPGDSVTATATSVLTQADVDAGAITSVVTGRGTPPSGGAAITRTASATVEIERTPRLVVTKDATPEGDAAVGDEIRYDFTIENLGNVTLSGVILTDALPGLGPITVTWPGADRVLAPGAEATATATYTITQADVDAGSVTNTASAGATGPGGVAVAADPVEVTTPTASADADLTTVKTATVSGSGGVGDVISYTITARNSGNVTLRDVTVADDLDGLTELQLAWPETAGVLAPGESVIATASYTITQADVDAGAVSNAATAQGTPPTGPAVTGADQLLTPTATANAAATLTKEGVLEAGSTAVVGELVEFTFRFANTGNVTLRDVRLTDELDGLSAIDVTWPGDEGVLAPGQAATATATYPLTQADIDSGIVTNTAALSADPDRLDPIERTAEASVDIPRTPSLSAVKTGVLVDDAIGQVGDVIQYEVVVTNTGNVTVTDGALVDPKSGLFDLTIAWPDPDQSGRVGVGESVTGRAKYRITQADVDAGVVENTAHVSAVAPGGVLVPADTNTVRVPTVQAAGALTVAKTGVIGGDAGVDAPIEYTFVIRNSGNVTLSGITLDDPMPNLSTPTITWPGATGVLAPGQQATALATYTVTQGDVDAGSVANTATATGSGRGGAVTSAPAPATVPTQGIQASIVVTKTGALEPDATGIAGDRVDWSYTLRNTSNVTLTGVTLLDRLDDTTAPEYVWPDPARPGVLLPGQTVTATASYTLTQADVDRGSVSSSVDGTGTPPRGAVVTGDAPASVLIEARPAISATKSSDVVGDGDVGDTIDYSFTITNEGNVTLTLVDLVDALSGVSSPEFVWPGDAGELAPTQTVTATAEYTITQADVDRGTVTNIATARGKPPVGDIITVTTPANETTVAGARPALVVEKDATVEGDGAVGDRIDYTFAIENTGNVTVRDIVLTDALPGLSTPVVEWPGEPGELAPGERATATADYRITQADVDAGEVPNTATATGTARGDLVVTPASVVTPVQDAAGAISVDKTGALQAGGTGNVGEIITYTFAIRNEGNVTLQGVELDDPLIGLSDIDIVWPGADGVLGVGATATGTATYALTQADIDAGAVANAVTATGRTPGGDAVEPAADSATVSIPRQGALTAVKTGVLTGGGIGQVGDVIQYEIVATNTGNLTITDGGLRDPMAGLFDLSIAWSGTAGRLEVGESVTGRAKYRITQADVDRGYIENTGTVGGTTTAGDVEVDTNTVRIDTVLPAPSLEVTKTGAATETGGAGDDVEYRFTIRNTGNVTLSGVTLTDQLPGVSAPVIDWPAADGVLAPGAVATATAEYTISQADVDAGEVRNVATAAGQTPRGDAVTADSPESVVPTEAATPAVTVTDTGAFAPGATGKAGDVVVWTYTFTNEGNVTLRTVGLRDDVAGVSDPVYAWPGTAGVLSPGQTVTATATYTLTQADVDAGSVSSLVTGRGTPTVGAPAMASAPATVSITPVSGLVMQKTAALADASRNGLGDTVTFGFRLENTGTVTLTGVAITDTLAGLGPIEITWPGAAGTLAPGAVATGVASYAITQDDVDRGQVLNTASVSGRTPTGTPVTGQATSTPVNTAAQAPAIATLKSASYVSGTGGVGSVIEYRFVISNTGNVTLNLIRIVDELVGLSVPDFEFPDATGILAPGASAEGTARYTVTQADVDAGSVENVATSFGTSPRGVVVSGTSNTVVTDTAPVTPPAEAIETTQTARLADGDTGVLGDTVEYTFTIENTGNTTLTNVTLENTVPGLQGFVYTWPDPAFPGRLLPGESVQVTATHTVTQADVDAGAVRNTATGTGDRPRGGEVSDDSVQTVVPLITPVGALTVTKSGTRTGDGSVGTSIAYEFTIRNSGPVTLSGVELTDALPGLSDIAYGTWPGETGRLAPGQSVTASAQYTIRQSDVDAGEVRNVATAAGETPQGVDVSGTSPASVVPTIQRAAHIDLQKTQTLAAGATGRPGDAVRFTFTFTNDGNVTLRGVTLGDAQSGLGTISIRWPGAPGVLAPGQTATATATYTLTQADVDAGRISSPATTSGTGAGTVVSSTDEGVTEIAAAPALTLDKTATVETFAQQGGGVIYRLTVTNTGNVTLHDVGVTDALSGLGAFTATWPGTPGSLASGEKAVFTARYVITQADVDRARIVNDATATGTAPGGEVVGDDDTVTVPVPKTSAIVLEKTITLKDGQKGYAGDTLVFHYSATNSGTTTLHGVVITDLYPGLSGLIYTWPGEPGVLLPGQTVTATATVVITPAMEGTVVSSPATVSGIDTDGLTVDATAVAAEPLPERPPIIPPGVIPPIGLPPTGGDPTPFLGAAALLLIGGLVLLIAARRRRSATEGARD